MRMNCFGDKVSSLHCKIVLLDEQQLVHEILMTTTGQDVLNVVYQHLGSNLLETAYFGLRYMDASHQPQWLDPNKKVLQQLKGASSQTLYFAVKFYAVDPCKLVEELTRYQFFLQIKKDVLQGRLPVSTELAAELAALALQSELGDYDPHRYKPGYVSEFRFLAHQSPDLETKIAELHKTMRGLVPAVAEMRYLDRVKWLDLYGVDLHPVLGEDTVEYFLGLTPSGIIVLRNKTKVGNYFWPRISKIQFKGRYFMLRVRDKSNDESTFGFETPSKSACKSLYKCCSQHLAFFRLVQMSGPAILNGTSSSSSNNSKFLKLAGVGPASSGMTTVSSATEASPPSFRRMPSRRHQRRIVDGASHSPQVDECSTSDSDKTLDAASTAALLSPYHASSKAIEAVPRNGDAWTEVSSVRSRRSRSHSRSRKERRSSSVDSTESRSQRRKSHHRSRSRHNSDNESEVSRVSESSRSSRRRRHRSSRESSGSESEQSSHHRSHRRHKRRDSQGSAYELVDSEAQWREIQERQGQQQMIVAATVRPAASSTPTTAGGMNHSVPVQQATVRKATNAVNVSMSSSVNDSTLDQSDINGVETSSHVSSRHRQHRKHHHRHHKHRSHSRSSDKREKPSLPAEIMPHLQFQLVDPPTGSTADQLREIPYQVVNSNNNNSSSSPAVSSALVSNTDRSDVVVSKKEPTAPLPQSIIQQETLSRKRHRALHPTYPPEERKIISVDNDSPPPPYSPPQNTDALAQTLASLNVNNRTGNNQQHVITAPIPTSRGAPPPIPGPKPNKSAMRAAINGAAQPYISMTTTTTATPAAAAVGAHTGSHQSSSGVVGMNGGRQNYAPQTSHHNPPATNGFYNGNMQYHHQQEIRQAATAISTSSASTTSNGGFSGGGNAYHYAYASQPHGTANAPAGPAAPVVVPSPHLVGLPPTGFMTGHSTPPTPCPQILQPMVRHNSNNNKVNHHHHKMNGVAHQQQHQQPEMVNNSRGGTAATVLPLSPLANGVTVTHADRASARPTIPTKYVTRPQTPVTNYANMTMTLPTRGALVKQQQRHLPPLRLTDASSGGGGGDSNKQFAVRPLPTIAYPATNSSGQQQQQNPWHASLPRLVRHLPAPQSGTMSTTGRDSRQQRLAADPAMDSASATWGDDAKPRRASSLELILSPMVQSTLQRKKKCGM